MYNFSVPSAVKAWIDQIVRFGQTFSYDGTNFEGLVTGKAAYVACASGVGGYSDGGALSAYNVVEPYLNRLLGCLGFTDVTFVGVEATTTDEPTVSAISSEAGGTIEKLARSA